MGLDNITEDLSELDLLAVTLLKELQSGQKANYFGKMNLYELPFEWENDEINCLPLEHRRHGYFLVRGNLVFSQTMPIKRSSLDRFGPGRPVNTDLEESQNEIFVMRIVSG